MANIGPYRLFKDPDGNVLKWRVGAVHIDWKTGTKRNVFADTDYPHMVDDENGKPRLVTDRGVSA